MQQQTASARGHQVGAAELLGNPARSRGAVPPGHSERVVRPSDGQPAQSRDRGVRGATFLWPGLSFLARPDAASSGRSSIPLSASESRLTSGFSPGLSDARRGGNGVQAISGGFEEHSSDRAVAALDGDQCAGIEDKPSHSRASVSSASVYRPPVAPRDFRGDRGQRLGPQTRGGSIASRDPSERPPQGADDPDPRQSRGHVRDRNDVVTSEKPRGAGLSEWAVEGSNLRPWD